MWVVCIHAEAHAAAAKTGFVALPSRGPPAASLCPAVRQVCRGGNAQQRRVGRQEPTPGCARYSRAWMAGCVVLMCTRAMARAAPGSPSAVKKVGVWTARASGEGGCGASRPGACGPEGGGRSAQVAGLLAKCTRGRASASNTAVACPAHLGLDGVPHDLVLHHLLLVRCIATGEARPARVGHVLGGAAPHAAAPAPSPPPAAASASSPRQKRALSRGGRTFGRRRRLSGGVHGRCGGARGCSGRCREGCAGTQRRGECR